MGITIWGWIAIAIGISSIIAGIFTFGYYEKKSRRGVGIALLACGILVGLALVAGILIHSGSEAGKRAFRDQQSNFAGYPQRTVTLYNVLGEPVEEYTGMFDVEIDETKDYVKFDDEGKRTILIVKTGAVSIVDD